MKRARPNTSHIQWMDKSTNEIPNSYGALQQQQQQHQHQLFNELNFGAAAFQPFQAAAPPPPPAFHPAMQNPYPPHMQNVATLNRQQHALALLNMKS